MLFSHLLFISDVQMTKRLVCVFITDDTLMTQNACFPAWRFLKEKLSLIAMSLVFFNCHFHSGANLSQ